MISHEWSCEMKSPILDFDVDCTRSPDHNEFKRRIYSIGITKGKSDECGRYERDREMSTNASVGRMASEYGRI